MLYTYIETFVAQQAWKRGERRRDRRIDSGQFDFSLFPRDDEVIRAEGQVSLNFRRYSRTPRQIIEKKKETFADKVGTFSRRSSRNDRDMKFRYVTLTNDKLYQHFPIT